MVHVLSEARARGPALVVGAVALLAGCGGGGPERSPRAACVPLPEEVAALRPATPWEPERSRVALDVAVPVAAITGELERRLPRELARGARVPVGAAGEATYRVRRGAFSLAARGGAVTVSAPIEADLELCKPVGPFCPTYGTCRPRLVAAAELPLAVRPGYLLGPIAIRHQFVRGCVLDPLGVDVTSELAGVAAREAAAVERRANDALPDLSGTAAIATRLLTLPVALGSELCLRVEPLRVSSGPAAVESGALSLRVGLEGTVRLEEPCGTADRRSVPPATALDLALRPGIALAVPVTLAWGRVAEELTRSLARGTGPTRVVRADALASGVAERPLALRLWVDGDVCGEVTVTASLRWDPAVSRVRLGDARVAEGQPRRARALGSSALLGAVERDATIALPADPSSWRAAIERAGDAALADLPAGWSGALTASPARVTSVDASTDGVVATVRLDAMASLSLRAPP
ncbi:MAG: DUF4403 family protein [Polyangiaceae bacterium]|nr:DUF4403 family protein [Polyangiaceae bacterium]